jgi:hypothetical protein
MIMTQLDRLYFAHQLDKAHELLKKPEFRVDHSKRHAEEWQAEITKDFLHPEPTVILR